MRINREIRIGEVATLTLIAVGMVGGWFALQGQVRANTLILKQTTEILDEMQAELRRQSEWQIRHDPSGGVTHDPAWHKGD